MILRAFSIRDDQQPSTWPCNHQAPVEIQPADLQPGYFAPPQAAERQHKDQDAVLAADLRSDIGSIGQAEHFLAA